MNSGTPTPPIESIFQAPTCRSLGLGLEVHFRNTARRLGDGVLQQSDQPLNIDLRAYHHGACVFRQPTFGRVDSGGALVVRDGELLKEIPRLGEEEELLLVARLAKPGSNGYFAQEHQLSYESVGNGSQVHILYDQQPLRTDNARPAPIVFMMPKIWLSEDVSTYILVSNVSAREEVAEQLEPVSFNVLASDGTPVCQWQHRFYYNEARAFDLKRRIEPHVKLSKTPTFFNLVGRGGAGLFVLFTVIRNNRTQHFAMEHSLPPIYYMDGNMQRVRAEACDIPRGIGT